MRRGVREKKDIRLFFALWPDDALRERLHRASETIPVERPARRVPRLNLHLTLHFIGNVYLDQMACLQQQAQRVDGNTFDLSIDCQGYFSKPRVAWLGCRETPTAMLDLQQRLGQQLQLCEYQPEARRYAAVVFEGTGAGLLGSLFGDLSGVRLGVCFGVQGEAFSATPVALTHPARSGEGQYARGLHSPDGSVHGATRDQTRPVRAAICRLRRYSAAL